MTLNKDLSIYSSIYPSIYHSSQDVIGRTLLAQMFTSSEL